MSRCERPQGRRCEPAKPHGRGAAERGGRRVELGPRPRRPPPLAHYCSTHSAASRPICGAVCSPAPRPARGAASAPSSPPRAPQPLPHQAGTPGPPPASGLCRVRPGCEGPCTTFPPQRTAQGPPSLIATQAELACAGKLPALRGSREKQQKAGGHRRASLAGQGPASPTQTQGNLCAQEAESPLPLAQVRAGLWLQAAH